MNVKQAGLTGVNCVYRRMRFGKRRSGMQFRRLQRKPKIHNSMNSWANDSWQQWYFSVGLFTFVQNGTPEYAGLNMQDAICKTQYARRNTQDSKRKTQNARLNTQDAIRKTQYARRNTQDSICKTQYARRNTQDSIRKTQYARRNTQHSIRTDSKSGPHYILPSVMALSVSHWHFQNLTIGLCLSEREQQVRFTFALNKITWQNETYRTA